VVIYVLFNSENEIPTQFTTLHLVHFWDAVVSLEGLERGQIEEMLHSRGYRLTTHLNGACTSDTYKISKNASVLAYVVPSRTELSDIPNSQFHWWFRE
jgi:hypothetical protein